MFVNVWQLLGVGVIATFSMDVLSILASRLRLTAPLPPQLIGRWFASVARAQPFHADIAQVPPIAHEAAIALPVHYLIGATLATFYVWTAYQTGWPARSLGFALAFGLCTSVLPWLLMFPAMGYGLFGAHGPTGTRLFISSLLNHALFGLGIWIGVRVIHL